MAEPDWNPDTGGRSLAEILREAGIETELGTRPGRRRRTTDDPAGTGSSPRVDGAGRAPRPTAGQPSPAAARSAAPGRPVGQAPAARSSSAAPGGQARVPGHDLAGPVRARLPPADRAGRSGRAGPGGRAGPRPGAGLVRAVGPGGEGPPSDRMSATGRVGERADVAPPPVRPVAARATRARPQPTTGPACSARARPPRRSPWPAPPPRPPGGRPPGHRADPRAARRGRAGGRGGRGAAHRQGERCSPGLRFAGELVVALAVGIGLYFAFTVLWELMPYVALVAAPASVTALVAGVAAYRQRRGQGSLGVRLLRRPAPGRHRAGHRPRRRAARRLTRPAAAGPRRALPSRT